MPGLGIALAFGSPVSCSFGLLQLASTTCCMGRDEGSRQWVRITEHPRGSPPVSSRGGRRGFAVAETGRNGPVRSEVSKSPPPPGSIWHRHSVMRHMNFQMLTSDSQLWKPELVVTFLGAQTVATHTEKVVHRNKAGSSEGP